jgi:hypothetical protein
MTYKLLLGIHVASGFTSLALGLIAIITQKGKKNHLLSGKYFVLSMYISSISAFIMTLLKPNQFLLAISIFTMYLIYSGNVSIKYFRLKENYIPIWKDKLPVFIAFLFSFYMIGQPVYRMIINQEFFISVLLIFGLIMLSGTISDFKILSNTENFTARNRMWLIKHISTISGAYIATVTAFLVTNIRISPAWIVWLAPTFIGTILISVAIGKWKTKLKLNN